MTIKTLHFTANMEFLCHTARAWFWDEGRPMSKALELIYTMMPDYETNPDECYKQAIDILEGRKIITGQDTGELMDDNQHVRPLSDMIEEQYHKIEKYKLAAHINNHPEFYVDTYVGGYSMSMYDDYPSTVEKVTRYRVGQDDESLGYDIDEQPLQYGLTWLYDMELAYEVLGPIDYSRDHLFEKLHDYYHQMLIRWKNEGLTYSDMNEYQQAVYHRNIMSAHNHGHQPHPYFDTPAMIDYTFIDTDYANENYSPAPTSQLDEHYHFDGLCDVPGEYYSEFALISPTGIYYSCGYGGHQIKATNIIEHHATLYAEYQTFKNNQPKDQHEIEALSMISEKLCVDFLVSQGWLLLKDQYHSGRVHVPRNHTVNDIQKQQIHNMVIYRQLNYHPITGKELNWEDRET